MNTRRIAIIVAASAATFLASGPAFACRGFGCGLVEGIPVLQGLAGAVDDGIASVKNRGSDADVLHALTGLKSWDNPVGRPSFEGGE